MLSGDDESLLVVAGGVTAGEGVLKGFQAILYFVAA